MVSTAPSRRHAPGRVRTNARSQQLCAWSGPVFMVAFLIGLLMAGLVPPPAPGVSAAVFTHRLLAHRELFRVGIVIALASVPLFGVFTAGLTVQLKRIEGAHSPMSYVQLGLGMLAVLLILFPMFWLLAAAFRPGRSDQLIQLLGDMAFLPFVGAWMTVVFQWIATAVAIFSDDAPEPVFPRWAAYFNLWVALLSVPSTLLNFVHSGPFAWNGLFSFWFALGTFGAWILVMTYLLLAAIRRQRETDLLAL
jgi:hypothetical protein